ncbi:hypothetical protein [Weissella koreensis]|uniref:hypothetical protein n=1 Tax=Weissella koreensis TaxID=165096 RepID=UPI00056DBD18|nr:hypothetical protein [Weissella koreensis]
MSEENRLLETYKKTLPHFPKLVETEKALYIDDLKLDSMIGISYDMKTSGPVEVTVKFLAESLTISEEKLKENLR